MRSNDTVARELAEIVQSNYYSEDFELLAAVRHYHDQLSAPERELLKAEILRRLQADGSLVEALLCGIVNAPEAVPVLAGLLDREEHTSPLTRALIGALRPYSDAAAYGAVARFLDSDQEREALAAMAVMDFARTWPSLDRFMRKDGHADACLHILSDRKAKVGLAAFLNELRGFASMKSPSFRERLAHVLTSKRVEYNPFSPDEIAVILNGLDQA